MQILNLSLQSLKTALGGLILLSFAVGFLCTSFVHVISSHAGMESMHGMHHASKTLILSSCCGNTNASDHMEAWKSTFVGIPQFFQDLLVLIVISIVAFGFSDFFATPRLNTDFLFLRYKQYARAHPDIRVFDALRLAFAKGILNPKTH